MEESELVREVDDEIQNLQKVIRLINRDENLPGVGETARNRACQLTSRHMHSEEYVQDLLRRLTEEGNNRLANQLKETYARAGEKVKPYVLVPSK